MAEAVVIWIASNAGGVGKTTLSIHIGYRLAQHGVKTLLVDLDTNGSLARFCGLESPIDAEQTSAALFSRQFNGNYPVAFPTWKQAAPEKFGLCLGGDIMVSVALDLPARTGREYVLQKTFKKFPPPAEVILLDSPASLDVLSYCALAAATHILIPSPMSIKISGVDSLLQMIRSESEELNLIPPPQILGGVPMKVAKNADQQMFATEIKDIFEDQDVHCFPAIRENKHFENAANRGIAPLYLYRPGNEACKDFEPIVDAIQSLLNKKN
ncbi:MAG: ParA family protein [Stenomitos rutilans HA7619-LM2]|jgi:chromosome partitioning protein|nr:ParA family protein [Stenomitos rutilans HA7619-LM2]